MRELDVFNPLKNVNNSLLQREIGALSEHPLAKNVGFRSRLGSRLFFDEL